MTIPTAREQFISFLMANPQATIRDILKELDAVIKVAIAVGIEGCAVACDDLAKHLKDIYEDPKLPAVYVELGKIRCETVENVAKQLRVGCANVNEAKEPA